MSDRSSAMLLIANRSIGTKIATGFAVVLLILAVSSVFAWLAFGSTAGALAEYARLVNRGAIYRDIDLQVAQYRGHVREYIFSNAMKLLPRRWSRKATPCARSSPPA